MNANPKKIREKNEGTILPLSLENICYAVDGLALLNDISIRFPDKGAITIVGPNGAGKTLLLRVCHGLLAPDKGHVHWGNPGLAACPGVQSMVFQRPVMLRRSAKDNILFALKACQVPTQELQSRLELALTHAKLGDMANRPAKKMSGGEQQRLALARCFALQPQVLFLDEPTAHLDPVSISHIERLIGMISDTGCQIVMVTHDLAQARRLGDHTLFMQGGEVVEFARTETFFTQPRSGALAAFLKGQDFSNSKVEKK